MPIIAGVFSGTTLIGVFEAIRYRRENKKIKASEATQADVEAQKAQIDLANKYRDEMLSMVNMVKEANEKNFINQDQILKKLDRLDERVGGLEVNYGNLEEWANGGYHQFLAEKEKGKHTRYGKVDNEKE